MKSREGSFGRSARKRFGPAKAARAERCVMHLKEKYGEKSSSPFAICNSAFSKHRKMGNG